MLKWFGALLDRIYAVIGAVVFAQIPLFIQQYSQQLVGREAELRFQVMAMRQSAALSGKTLEELIAKFLVNPDIDVVRQGELMKAIVSRWEGLSSSLFSLQNSNVFDRPFVFILHMNGDAFRSTFENFSFGLPLTVEGGIYAFIGLLAGFGLFAALRKLVRVCSRVFT